MGQITRVTKRGGGLNFNAGQAILSGEVNDDFNALYAEVNGNLDDSNIETGTLPGSKAFRFTEIAEPPAPASNDIVVYAADDGNDATKLYTKDSTGTVTPVGTVSCLYKAGGAPFKSIADTEDETSIFDEDEDDPNPKPTIRAGTFRNAGGLRIMITGSVKNDSGAARGFTLKHKLGATELTVHDRANSIADAGTDTYPWFCRTEILSRGSANAQVTCSQLTWIQTATNFTTDDSVPAALSEQSIVVSGTTLDLTVDQDFDVLITPNHADPNFEITVHTLIVEQLV
jgi:hypothetical protein